MADETVPGMEPTDASRPGDRTQPPDRAEQSASAAPSGADATMPLEQQSSVDPTAPIPAVDPTAPVPTVDAVAPADRPGPTDIFPPVPPVPAVTPAEPPLVPNWTAWPPPAATHSAAQAGSRSLLSGRHRTRWLAGLSALAVALAAGSVGIIHEVATGSSVAAESAPAAQNPLGNGSGTAPFGNGQQFGPGGNGDGFGDGDGSFGRPGPGGAQPNTSGLSASEISSIASSIKPAVVDIVATFSYQRASGAGTGIVLTSDGYVLTNNHVINGATSLSVTDIGNGKTYNATVVGYDSTHDVALLKLANASGLQTAGIGDSSALSVGDAVVAVGNAGGVGGEPSSAAGSVTALHQAITASDALDGTSEQLSGLIRVDAAVRSGDSGGPMVTTDGKVVGMTTAASQGYSLSSSDNAGFAIPINEAMAIVDQIRSGQETSTVHIGGTAFLGVLVSTAPGRAGATTTQGAPLAGVVPGGAAAKDGLAQGDTITAFDGHAVTSPTGLTTLMLSHHPGDQVKVTWVDVAGQTHHATVTLQSGPPA